MQAAMLHPLVDVVHSIVFTTAESDPIKAGEMRSLCVQTSLRFRPMSIECPLVVAQRFHLASLQVGNKGVSMRFATQNTGSPVAVWTVYDAPTLFPGQGVELMVTNVNGVAYHFAATLVGSTQVGL